MAGRKAKPTALKLLQGNAGKRKINKREPKPEGQIPEPPDWLNDQAREAWKVIAPRLGAMKVLTSADATALELMCAAYSEWRLALEAIEDEGLTYETTNQNGGTMYRARPEVGIASDAWRRIVSIAREFGLTPASRPGLVAGGKEKGKSAWDELVG